MHQLIPSITFFLGLIPLFLLLQILPYFMATEIGTPVLTGLFLSSLIASSLRLDILIKFHKLSIINILKVLTILSFFFSMNLADISLMGLFSCLNVFKYEHIYGLMLSLG